MLGTIHDARFLEFLESAWRDWIANGNRGELIPTTFPVRGMRQRIPENVEGKAGYYTFAIETAIAAGTWQAALSSAAVALTPPGMSRPARRRRSRCAALPAITPITISMAAIASSTMPRIAAQGFRDTGAQRVAILDVDFHHGNGTQDIFYRRNDVLFCSLHGQPEDAFPYFLGFADEIGHGEGEGLQLQLPDAAGHALRQMAGRRSTMRCGRSATTVPTPLVVSLGVDTYKDDPISFFKLESDDFTDLRRGASPS